MSDRGRTYSIWRVPFGILLAASFQLTTVFNTTEAQDVSFSNDLASVLSKRCMNCHSGDRPRRALRIDSYSTLMRGSENGPVIEAGDPENSLLILKMKGEADGDRMPPNGPPLSDRVIAKFSAWIGSGARFDGKDPTFALDRLATASRRQNMSSDELIAEAIEQAKAKWRLAFSGAEPKIRLSNGLLFVGEDAAAEENPVLDDAGREILKGLAAAKKLLGLSDYTMKSPLTIFHIPRSYDFAEFTQMVERRDATKAATDYWRPDGGNGYLVLGPQPSSSTKQKSKSSKSVPSRLSPAKSTRFACALLLNRIGAPEWYADGVSFLALEQASRKSPTISHWKRRAPSVLQRTNSAQQILEAGLPPQDADVARWAFARFLATDKKRMTGLHQSISEGNGFDRSFAAIFGRSADKLCDEWLKRFKRGRRK